MDDAIEAYLTYLRVERGLSAATISAYSGDLRAFARFAAARSGDWTADAQVASDIWPRSPGRRACCVRRAIGARRPPCVPSTASSLPRA